MQTDVLVLSSPIYWKGFTSQIKRVIDRLYQFSAPKGRETCRVKETFLISACASPDPEMFDAVRKEYQHINEMLNFVSVGELLASGLAGADDIKTRTEELEKAVTAGYSIGREKESAAGKETAGRTEDAPDNAETTAQKPGEVGSMMRQHKEGCWFV